MLSLDEAFTVAQPHIFRATYPSKDEFDENKAPHQSRVMIAESENPVVFTVGAINTDKIGLNKRLVKDLRECTKKD